MALTVFSKAGGSGGGERGELELLFFRLQQTAGFLKSDPGCSRSCSGGRDRHWDDNRSFV